MKNFLSKYWKRILIIITGILIIINIVVKTSAPHTLVEEYAKYGSDVKASSVSINTREIADDVRSSAPMSDDMFRIAIVLVIGLLAAVILSDIANRKPASAAKKK